MSAAVPSAGSARLPTLDALRALGAVAVVGTHVAFATGAVTQGVWGGFLARLDVGVAVFFVLSGFLLFRPYAHAAAVGDRRPGTVRYLWRRALRILPAYWLTVIVCLSLVPANAQKPVEDWVRFLTLTHIYEHGWLSVGLVQTWSLATEVAFYLLLPLIAIASLGRRWRPLRTAIILAAGSILITGAWLIGMTTGVLKVTVHTSWLPTFAIWFGAGMALATAHVALRTESAPRSWSRLDDLGRAPLACGVVALGLFAIVTTPLSGPRDLTPFAPAELGVKLTLYLGVAVMVLIPAAFNPQTGVTLVLASASGRWLGAVSYGLFLWHPLVLEAVYFVMNRPNFSGGTASIFLLTLGCGLVVASVSYYIVELPIRQWGARWPRRMAHDRRQPYERDGEDTRELRPAGVVPVVAGHREPAGDEEQQDREPSLQRA